MTKQNSDECRIENNLNFLWRSPSSNEFSSLWSTHAAREISKLKTEKIEPQIRDCVQSYKLQMEMQKHFVHERPKDSSSWEMPEVHSLIDDPRVYSIDGPMCRWSLRTRGSGNKTEFMRKRTRWITSSKEIVEILRGDGRWKRNKRLGQSETAIKRQMISCGAIRIGEMHFAGPVPDEGDNPTEFEGNWESTACGLIRNCYCRTEEGDGVHGENWECSKLSTRKSATTMVANFSC